MSRQQKTIETLTEVVQTQANTIAALVAVVGRKEAPAAVAAAGARAGAGATIVRDPRPGPDEIPRDSA